jgi:hypothetical protein
MSEVKAFDAEELEALGREHEPGSHGICMASGCASWFPCPTARLLATVRGITAGHIPCPDCKELVRLESMIPATPNPDSMEICRGCAFESAFTSLKSTLEAKDAEIAELKYDLAFRNKRQSASDAAMLEAVKERRELREQLRQQMEELARTQALLHTAATLATTRENERFNLHFENAALKAQVDRLCNSSSFEGGDYER